MSKKKTHTEDEIRSLFKETSEHVPSRHVEIMAPYVDAKCATAFKRGRHLSENDVETLHDRLDKLTKRLVEIELDGQKTTQRPKLSKGIYDESDLS